MSDPDITRFPTTFGGSQAPAPTRKEAVMALDTKTIKVTFEFVIPTHWNAEEAAEAVFDVLCSQEDDAVPYESCDGWDLADGGL